MDGQHDRGESKDSEELLSGPTSELSSSLVIEDMNIPNLSAQPSPAVIAIVLVVTILGFTVQTEATAYYQEVLNWPKPFASLYLTHSSLVLPWLVYQVASPQRSARRKDSWLVQQVDLVTELAMATDSYQSGAAKGHDQRSTKRAALSYLLRTMAIETAVLTVSGLGWFVALAWTTPSDLTVIYNCSAFFAAVFSVPLLDDRLTRNVVLAVAVSFVGTVMIAYGSGSSTNAAEDEASVGSHRVLGNSIAMVGSCAYGLYCVLFKKWTTSTERSDAVSSMRTTFAASAITGLYTLSLFWIGLLVLHFTGLEPFQLPSLQVCFYLVLSVLPGCVSMTFVLVLTTWTTPVFGSVASILSVFFVAIADWILYGILPTLSTYIGGALIFFAFGLLSWDQSTR